MLVARVVFLCRKTWSKGTYDLYQGGGGGGGDW
jgi:hypothetical protein